MFRRGSEDTSFVEVMDTNVNYQTYRCDFNLLYKPEILGMIGWSVRYEVQLHKPQYLGSLG